MTEIWFDAEKRELSNECKGLRQRYACVTILAIFSFCEMYELRVSARTLRIHLRLPF